ncbi:MAG: AraC family transcriptional regulator [Verrucomicrobiota bacterium]
MSLSTNATEIRDSFRDAVGHDAGFPGLFEHLERVSFFLKNTRFQIVHANRHFFERLGFRHGDDIVGKEDFELFPKPLAQKFRRDDERVLRTGEEMPRMIELFLSRQGLPDWFITNKLPVRSKSGDVIGIMGTVERYERNQALASDPAIAEAVKWMLERPGDIESLADVAAELGISHRHFDRRFKEVTGLTPKYYLGRSRVQAACRMLRKTGKPIAEIALELGYCDQSAFTAQFRQCMGFTPLRYRKQFGSR